MLKIKANWLMAVGLASVVLTGCSGGRNFAIPDSTNSFALSGNTGNAVRSILKDATNRGGYRDITPGSLFGIFTLTGDPTQELFIQLFSNGDQFRVGDTIALETNFLPPTPGKGYITYEEKSGSASKLWTSRSGTARITAIQLSSSGTVHPLYGPLYGNFTIEVNDAAMQPSTPPAGTTNQATGNFTINGHHVLTVYKPIPVIN